MTAPTLDVSGNGPAPDTVFQQHKQFADPVERRFFRRVRSG
jgi:hypothetical protein